MHIGWLLYDHIIGSFYCLIIFSLDFIIAKAAIPPRIAVVNCRIPIVFRNITGIKFNLNKSRAIKKRKKAFAKLPDNSVIK